MKISSKAFGHNEKIPAKYSCHGDNTSPPLAWDEIPNNTKSLALIMDDPDAPHGAFTHWILYNIPPTATHLEEAVTTFPEGAQFGLNSVKKTSYTSPCPPSGNHHYHFKLYALDTTLTFDKAPNSKILQTTMQHHILATSELVGIYP